MSALEKEVDNWRLAFSVSSSPSLFFPALLQRFMYFIVWVVVNTRQV